MKARSAFVLVVLFLIAGRTQAGGVDNAKLRELANLPSISFIFGFGFSTISGFHYGDMQRLGEGAEIAKLLNQMKGDPSDAERYLLLGRHYSIAKREKEEKEAFGRAIALCRQQVRDHPKDMSWQILLGDALLHNAEFREAETLLRQAVKEAPNDWRAWLALAEYVDCLAYQPIFVDKHVNFSFRDQKPMLSALLDRKPTVPQMLEMRRMREEAQSYFRRAVALAPANEVKPYLRRVACGWGHAQVEGCLRIIQRNKVDLQEARVFPEAVFLEPEIIPDMRRIAQLRPDDPQAVGAALFWDIMSCVTHNKLETREELSSWADYLARKNRTLVDVIPLESRESVRWCIERLEQLTKHPDKATAAAASEVLAIWLSQIKDVGQALGISWPIPSEKQDTSAKVLEHLRRTMQLDPSSERAWDWLTAILSAENKTEEAIAVACKRVGLRDNARNRFLLAKAYEYGNQFDKAAQALQAGLKSDPKDLYCLLGRIALALKREDAQSLKEAGEQLEAVAPRFKEMQNGQRAGDHGPFSKEEESSKHRADYLLLSGIHFALIDRHSQAKAAFRQILQLRKGDSAAILALVALGEPLRSADQQIAIDFIRKKGGWLACKDRRAHSPVVGIHFRSSEITNEDLVFLPAFPQLHELNLSFSSITDEGLARVAGLTDLRSLRLDYTKITDKGFARLKALPELRNLSLAETKITNAGLSHLEAFPKLEHVQLSGIDGKEAITDAGLVQLHKLPKLQSVTVSSSITDKGLADLAAIPHLRRLVMLPSKITDEGMRHIARLSELEELWLSDAKITDAGLVHLKGLRNLQMLHLGGTKITDAGLAHLKDLSRLEELELDGTAISDAGLAQLSGLTNLRKLNLGDSERKNDDSTASTKPPLTGIGLKYLQDLTKLTHLKLNGRQITEAGMSNIEKFTHLECLSLDMAKITDADLKHLRSLKQLKLVTVRNTKVTRQGVAELQKELPKLEVYR